MSAVRRWAVAQVERMRDGRRDTNTNISEHLAQFIASLPGRLIITKHFGDSRSGVKEHPIEMLRGPAVGRVCTEDKKVYVTAKAMADWCKEVGVPPADMREEMDRLGYLIMTTDGTPGHSIRIGSGTTTPSATARCYEINYHKLFDGRALSLVQTGGGERRRAGHPHPAVARSVRT